MLAHSIIAIIPAFNAATTIHKVVNDLKKTPKLKIDIVVVDDGSIDGTFDICHKLDIHVIKHSTNSGKGLALRSGFQYAIDRNADFILTIDSDNQHNPFDAIRLYEHLIENRYDMVIGNRMHNLKSMPFHRILSNVMTSKILSWMTRQKIEDSQCGFRLIKTGIIKKIKLSTIHFDLESEIILETAKNDFKIGFAPIETIYRKDSTSFVKAIDVFRFVRLMIKNL